jgi:hypothetical protein
MANSHLSTTPPAGGYSTPWPLAWPALVSQEVEFARQPAGGLKECFVSGGLEQGQLGAGETEAVGKIGRDLLTGERRQVIAHDDALRESLVDGHGEPPSQLGLTEQQKTEPVFGVHLVVGQPQSGHLQLRIT